MAMNGIKGEKAEHEGLRFATKIAFFTLGCKVNQFDTEGLITESREHGYEVVDFNGPADIYVLNTCTVTKEAERKARQLMRRVKRKYPDAYLVVTGCFAQTSAEVLTALPEVDLVIGVAGRGRLFQILEEELPLHSKNQVLPWTKADGFELFAPEFSGQTRAFLEDTGWSSILL